MPDRTDVARQMEGWHLRMDADATALVEKSIHDGVVLRDVLERVQKPLLDMRRWSFQNRMMEVVDV